jgi:hypothetical protein
MIWRLLLDILPHDGHRPIRHPIIKPVDVGPAPDVVDTATTSPHVVDSASVGSVTDSAQAAQDLVVGGVTGGDDMTMLFASIFVVFFALALCLYFVFAYRRSLRPGVK